MARLHWKPAPLLYPVPAVLVSCGTMEDKPNIITVAWAGTVNSKPPMVGLAIRPERYSYDLIQRTGDLVVNLPPKELMRAVDLCGVRSGREVDKFEAARLTPEPSTHISAPRIKECPVSLECRVEQVLPLGSHHLFIARILGVEVEEELVDASGRLDLERADLLAYVHGRYHGLQRGQGFFGFSVAKHRGKPGEKRRK